MGATLIGVCGHQPPIKPGPLRQDPPLANGSLLVFTSVLFDRSVVAVLSSLFLNTEVHVYGSPRRLGAPAWGRGAASARRALRVSRQSPVQGPTETVRQGGRRSGGGALLEAGGPRPLVRGAARGG